MKILANKPDDPSPVPESYMMEGENRFLRAGLWLPHVKSMCMHVCASLRAHARAHTHNVIKIHKQGGDQLRKTQISIVVFHMDLHTRTRRQLPCNSPINMYTDYMCAHKHTHVCIHTHIQKQTPLFWVVGSHEKARVSIPQEPGTQLN